MAAAFITVGLSESDTATIGGGGAAASSNGNGNAGSNSSWAATAKTVTAGGGGAGHGATTGTCAAGAAGKTVTIIVTKVDRLGRDTVDVSNTASLFDSLRARLILLDINVDTRTAMGRAFMQIAAVFAELERARIRERIQDGLDRKRQDGEVIGSVPFGWDAEETGETTAKGVKIRRLVANVEEQKWILHIARRRAAGASLNSIAKDLNRSGVATKRRGERLNMRSSKSSPLVTKRTSGLCQAGQVKKIFANKKVQAFLSQFES